MGVMMGWGGCGACERLLNIGKKYGGVFGVGVRGGRGEIREGGYGGVVNGYNVGGSVVGVRGVYLGWSEDMGEGVVVEVGGGVRVSCFLVLDRGCG